MIMLSMDGPNTNWRVYENLKSHLTEKKFLQIIDVRSYGLHVVDGAFHTGEKTNGWKFEKVLNAIWQLINDSSARRDLYIQLKTSDVFQLMFFQTR